MHCSGCAASVLIVDLIFGAAARTIDLDFDAATGNHGVAGN